MSRTMPPPWISSPFTITVKSGDRRLGGEKITEGTPRGELGTSREVLHFTQKAHLRGAETGGPRLCPPGPGVPGPRGFTDSLPQG